jgi:hypothetical protein
LLEIQSETQDERQRGWCNGGVKRTVNDFVAQASARRFAVQLDRQPMPLEESEFARHHRWCAIILRQKAQAQRRGVL